MLRLVTPGIMRNLATHTGYQPLEEHSMNQEIPYSTCMLYMYKSVYATYQGAWDGAWINYKHETKTSFLRHLLGEMIHNGMSHLCSEESITVMRNEANTFLKSI